MEARAALGLLVLFAALAVLTPAVSAPSPRARIAERRDATPDRSLTPRTLVVQIDGSGRVTSSPAGIDCPSVCSAEFDSSQRVTLTAAPAAGYRLRAWADTPSDQLTYEVPDADSFWSFPLRVSFVPAATLQLIPNGPGSITVTPAGFDLGLDAMSDSCPTYYCQLAYLPGTVVKASAQPNGDSRFVGFSSFDCPLTVCDLTLAADTTTLTATFSPLQLGVKATGTGRIVASPSGLSCDVTGELTQCVAPYPARAGVVLTAVGEDPEWLAGCKEGPGLHAASCHVSVDASQTWVFMRFGNAEPPDMSGPQIPETKLTVSTDHRGRVKGDKIDCGDSCSARYSFGDHEHLKAVANHGFRFKQWLNGCGERQQCEIPVGPVTSLKALFVARLQAHLLRVAVLGHGSRRRLSVRISSSAAARLTLRLKRPAGARVASRSLAIEAGRRTVSLAVPRRTRPGRYRLVAIVSTGGQQVRSSRMVAIGR
jgi:Divergent InlB B-repeat domain